MTRKRQWYWRTITILLSVIGLTLIFYASAAILQQKLVARLSNDLTINGPVSLHLLPSPVITLQNVVLHNNKVNIKIAKGTGYLDFLPLLQMLVKNGGEIPVKYIKLDDASVLLENNAVAIITFTSVTASHSNGLWHIVTNGQIAESNAQLEGNWPESFPDISNLDLTLDQNETNIKGRISFHSNETAEITIVAEPPQWLHGLHVKAVFSDGLLEIANAQAEFPNVGETSLSGRASLIDDAWKIDGILAKASDNKMSSSFSASLKEDANFTIEAKPATYNLINFETIGLKGHLADSSLILDEFSTDFYGGKISGNGEISRNGHITLQGNMSHLNLHDLLYHLKSIDFIETSLDGIFTLQTTNFDPNQLSGDIILSGKGGFIKGFNLTAVGEKLRNPKGIGGLLSLLSGGIDGGKTNITSLSAPLRLDHGIIGSNNMKLTAEGGSADGQLRLDLINNLVDSRIVFHLSDIPDAPPLIWQATGSINAPNHSIDINPIQNWLIEKTGKNIGKPKDILRGLLGK